MRKLEKAWNKITGENEIGGEDREKITYINFIRKYKLYLEYLHR